MSIGQNIKRRRRELDMTLEQVANLVGLSRQTLSRYETGVIGNIPSDKIEALAVALRTTPAYLMGWDNTEPTSVSSLTSANIVRIAGRDGSYIEKRLTDQQIQALRTIIDQMPDAEDI